MSVAVVTDSTAYLPAGLVQRHAVRSVPLHVVVDGERRLDGVDFGPAELARALGEHQEVTTSRPHPAELAAVYQQALDGGAEAVVAVHLSAELSSTWQAAWLAAKEVDQERVRIVDARSTAMGLGFAVLAAARAAADGASPAQVEAAATRVAARTTVFFSLETLEYLRRGGRISATSALLGTALAVKPILHVLDGRIVPLEKVRTAGRAMTRLVDLAVDAAGREPVALAVHHLGSQQRATELVDRLLDRLPKTTECLVSEVGAVIGAHTGPGVLGVVVVPGGVASS